MMGVTKPAKAQSRLMRHPGPASPVRIEVCRQYFTRVAKVELRSGSSMLDGLCGIMAELANHQRLHSASFEIIGGNLAPAVFCAGIADTSGEKLATYSPWREACDVSLLGGAGTIGLGLDGQPLIHAHAWFVRTKGEVCGGHLDAVASICGAKGISLRLFVHDAFFVSQLEDAETGYRVFTPVNIDGLAA